MILSPPAQIWYCPKCTAAARTVDAKLPMHDCPGMAGLHVPLVREGERADHVAQEREDYIGKDLVRLDANGRPIMGVTTRREDGEDRTVYAPTVNVNLRDL